jgi:hypothetical protein
MWRFLFVAMFAALAGPSLGACELKTCDPGECSSDCPESCPNGVYGTDPYGTDPDTFVPPTPPASCPADADRICADGYLYSCTDGRVTSTFYSCRPGTACVEIDTSDGRRAAACSTFDEPCASDAPRSAECRSNDRIACEYGLVTLRSSCGVSTCVVDAGPVEYPSARCDLVN